MRWGALVACVLTIGCNAWSERQPLDGPTCVRIDPRFTTEEIETVLDAFDAWEPHPVTIDTAIGGTCANEIKLHDHEKFRREQPAKMFTNRVVLLTGSRGQTDIFVNPHIDWAAIDEDIGKPYCQLREGLEHEIGHLFGMSDDDHADVTDERSIMIAQLNGCTGRTVTEDDHAILDSIY